MDGNTVSKTVTKCLNIQFIDQKRHMKDKKKNTVFHNCAMIDSIPVLYFNCFQVCSTSIYNSRALCNVVIKTQNFRL